VFGHYDLDEYMGEFSEEDDIGSLLEWGSDGLQYEGSLESSVRGEEDSTSVAEAVPEWVGDMEVFRRAMSSHWQQVPLDRQTAECCGKILTSLTDEELMTMSPTLLTHLLRTEAQGGVQVISPRQVTLGGIAGRTLEETRQPDMHIVGSNATRGLPWPVAAGHILAGLWYREPLDAYPNTPAVRSRVRTEAAVPGSKVLSDPLEMALVRSRALVDMQKRPDVGGDAEGLSDVISAAWGLDAGVFDDLGGALIGGTGNLLRYAIGPDKHYPVVHAPIQARKVLSVAAMATGRDIYGEFAALDWRRMRVLCEAVFYISSRTEGHTMEDMASPRPIGDPTAPANRNGIMQFRPLPGAVWSFEPRSFALKIGKGLERRVGMVLPERVADVMAKYVEEVPQTTRAAAKGSRITYSGAVEGAYVSAVSESIVSGFQRVKSTAAAFQMKGYSSSSAVRGFVFQCIEGDTTGAATEAAWITRAVHSVAKTIGLAHTVDARMAKQVAGRMGILTDDLRQKLVVEAERHGETLEEWWDDFAARLPLEIRCMGEGTGAWACGLAWYLMRQPDVRWVHLSTALAAETHRALAATHLGRMRLPGAMRSEARIREAVAVTAARLARSYGSYYRATADACRFMADRLARAGSTADSQIMRLAGLTWSIRANATLTISVVFRDLGQSAASRVLVAGDTASLTTAPYKAYALWREEAKKMRLDLSGYPAKVQGKVSHVFSGKKTPMLDTGNFKGARPVRYLDEPDSLSEDMEKTFGEIRDTLEGVADFFATEGEMEEWREPEAEGIPLEKGSIDMMAYRPAPGSLWDVIVQLESHDSVWIADTLEDLDERQLAKIEGMRYESGAQLKAVVEEVVAEAERRGGGEAVN